MKKIVFLFLFALLILRANCQTGATQRTALVNLQKAGIVESSRAGQFGLTDANGNQRYAQFVEVDLTPIAYTPPTTGNTQNFSEFVTTTGGDIYYIDWQGRSIKLWAASAGGGGTSDFDWLEIGNNQVPNSILDSIYTSKYAAINMRRIWPNAQLLVGDSTGTNGASGIAAGDRSARWGFVRMLDGSWSSIGQEGTNNTVRLGPGTVAMKIQVAAGASPSEAIAPFRDVASFRTDSLIRFNDYPNTRNDTATAVNFFYSDAQGYLKSGPVSEISGGGGTLNYFAVSGGNLGVGNSADTMYTAVTDIAPIQSLTNSGNISIVGYPAGAYTIGLQAGNAQGEILQYSGSAWESVPLGITIPGTTSTAINTNISLYGFSPAYSNSGGTYIAASTTSASTLHQFYITRSSAGKVTFRGSGEAILSATFSYTPGTVYYLDDAGALATSTDADFDSAAVYIIANIGGGKYLANLLSPKHFAN